MIHLERFSFFKKKNSLDVRSWYDKSIEDLVDCLYEVFDEFSIPQNKSFDINYDYLNWRIVSDHHIEIFSIPKEIQHELYNKIIALRETIEKRINHPILIEFDKYRHLIEIFFKEKSEDKVDEGIFNILKKKEVEKLYKFISVYDALIYRSEHKIDVLSDSEISKIKEVVKNPFSLTKVKFETDRNSRKYIGNFISPQSDYFDCPGISFRLRDINFFIEKFNDDWYILNKHDMDNNVSNYLCDQFEGLIQCIKNEIRIF